jgi:hypothetical protein
VPVSLLALAIVISAAIGLSLSNNTSARSVADELGCEHVSSSHPQPGVSEETCSYHGDTVVILSLSKGPHALYPPDVPNNFILAPEGKPVVIGCQSREDCVLIHRQLGGDLNSGPMLGLSLVIR